MTRATTGPEVVASRRRLIYVALGTATAAVVALWLVIPWEWSMIDDPGLVLGVRTATAENGWPLGLFSHVGQMFTVDLDWGLFRPAYWIYPSLVYPLPIEIAHLVRLLMVVVAVAGPLVGLRRRGASWPVVAMAGLVIVTAGASLLLGLFYVSLQELSAAFFVGLGLMVRGHGARLAMWTIAAWFKAPFVWLLVAESVSLWRKGERAAAAVGGSISVVTLLAAGLMARNGSYTSGYLAEGVVARVLDNVPLLVDSGGIALILALVWWFAVARGGLRWDSYSAVLLVGWLGYTAQMLPWTVTGHYQAGIYYLFALAVGSMIANPRGSSPRRLAVALVVPAVMAAMVASIALKSGFERNLTLGGITDCLLASEPGNVLLAREFGPEAAVRMAQNVQIQDGDWSGTVTYYDSEGLIAAGPMVDLVIIPTTQPVAVPEGFRPVCALPYALVLRR